MESSPFTIHQELRNQTAPQHIALENFLADQNSFIDKSRYVATLEAFASYYAPLERQIKTIAINEFEQTSKLNWLAADLAYFDLPLPSDEADVPAFTTPAEALGALYVTEGAALGGQYITKQLEQTLGLKENGVRFFSSDGANVPLRWKQFRLSLADFVQQDKTRADEVIAAAATTFTTIHEWFEFRLAPTFGNV